MTFKLPSLVRYATEFDKFTHPEHIMQRSSYNLKQPEEPSKESIGETTEESRKVRCGNRDQYGKKVDFSDGYSHLALRAVESVVIRNVEGKGM